MKMPISCRAGVALSWLTLAVLACGCTRALAAEGSPASATNAKRPKVCLVLSGGGARGAAHLGVLKVLEEYRVPIDCIVGTSMGALVGGSYASGMTVDELGKMTGEISKEVVFKDEPARREQSLRRKQDDHTILFGPELGVRDGKLRGGRGLVSGVQLEAVLRQLSKAKGYYEFDALPIPFRAVATDLVTGKAVIFHEGDLASVMRASMSVPGAFAPAEINGTLLVDGMLTSNLPVETARDLGADVIIAVNVGTPLLTRDQLNGILGVTGQMLSILTEQNVQASLAALRPTDILISPELGDFSTSDFDDLAKIVPLGEVAARKMADRLAQLSLPAEQYAALRVRQQIAAVPELQPVDEIRFENLQRVNPGYAQSVMQTKVGQPIDQATLDADMRRLYGTGDFEHVQYNFLEEPGRRVLAVDAVEKNWGPDYLRFGLGLSSDFSGGAYFNVLASYRKTWLNSLGAEWRTNLQIGRTSDLYTEFYQPLDTPGMFFVAPHADVGRRSVDLYKGDQRIASYNVTSALGGGDVGVNFQRYGELRLGAVAGALQPSLETGPTSLTPLESSVKQGAFTVRLILDQLDSAKFPRSGWSGGAKVFNSTSALGADDAYTKWDVEGSAVYSLGENTFNLGAKGGDRIGTNLLPRYDEFQWGGFLEQSGYATGQLVGQRLVFGRAMYYRRFSQGTLLEGVFGGFSLEAGKVDEPLVPGNPVGWLRSASAFVAIDTPLGPAYLAYGRAADGSNSFYFYLGKPF